MSEAIRIIMAREGISKRSAQIKLSNILDEAADMVGCGEDYYDIQDMMYEYGIDYDYYA